MLKSLLRRTAAIIMAVALLPGLVAARTLWTCGDSTMADYATDGSTPTRGWCQFIDAFFEGDIQVINKGKGGQDVHSFINLDAYWPYIKKNLKPGDYVLLQFAHNDEKNNGMDGYELRDYYLSVGNTTAAAAVDLRGSVPNRTYIEMLEDLVNQIRAAGAYPVFASSICRFYFDGNDIKRNGRHDLGDGYQVLTADGPKSGPKLAADDHSMDYRYQMEQLAKKLDVPFIDMTQATRELYLKYGETNCKTMIGNGEDGTHLGVSGAVLIGRLGAQLLKEAGILADYINLGSADISFNPSDGYMGEAYIGNILTSEFTMTGFGLSPAKGNVSFSVTDGFEISADKASWGKTASIAYESGTLIGTLYVRASLEAPGTVNGVITATAGEKSSELKISADAIPLPGSGSVNLTWPLNANNAYTLDGELGSATMKLVGLKAESYNGGINILPENGVWPAGDIDESPTRYIEFALTPAEGKALQLNNISMNISSPDTDLLQCHVNYSTDANYADPRTFWAPATIEKGANNAVATNAMINVGENGQLMVRIYPWAKSELAGAPLRIANVNISGYSVNASQTTSITWPLGKGDADPASGETASSLFAYSTTTIGSDLTVKGTGTYNTAPCTLYQPVVNNQSDYTDAGSVAFTVCPKNGVTFQPTHVSLYGTRIGTDGGTIQVSLEYGDKKEILGTGLKCQRNNTGDKQTFFEFDINGAVAFGTPVTVRVAIAALGNTKQIALRDIKIEGEISGTPVAVPAYAVSVTKNYDEAGTVKVTPNTPTVDENTIVTLEATENFGYSFLRWESAGKTLSTANPYSFSAKEDVNIVAVYEKHNIYPMTVSVTGGANEYMVTVNPDGQWIDGKRWYVEGADVILTPVGNPALTFTNWEDNTTAMPREIKVNGPLDVVANFSAGDYILGWDFTLDEPKADRAADIKAESDNSGLFCLRNAAGTTTSWLSKGNVSGADFGRYGARVWKDLSLGNYFEASFSAKGYSNIRVISAIQHSFNTYGNFLFQCSTDGENFVTVGEASPAFKAWTDTEFALPAECNDAERVWFRWYPDANAELIGSSSNLDGLTISGIYVLADSNAADDDTAPVMTSSIPADGSNGASVTGSIILTFDERVKPGTGKATLAGRELTPTVSGKSVIYPYSGLDYNTDYTFTLEEGAVTDRSGNKAAAATIRFTTMERTQPDAKTFDAIVDCNGGGDYLTVQEAIDAAPAARVKPWLILVLNGRYKGHVDIPSTKPFIHIVGQDRDKTVICDDLLCGGDNALHVSKGATVVVNSDDCFFENITLENTYGHEKQTGPQALALNTIGDRSIFNNVAILSYQDTWITTSNSAYRTYVKNSFIEGAVDFIYNSGDIYIENTTLYINRKDGGFIVAPSHAEDVKWGYVFRDCTITAPGVPSQTSVWLGRPWHGFPKTVFLNTRAEVTIPATGWYETMGGLPAIWADWNTVDANGNLLDLSQRRDTYYMMVDGEKVYGKAKNHLTDEEAAEYTVQNVLTGSDNWQPVIKTEACAAPAITLDGTTLSWQPVPYAICYLVTSGDKYVGMTTDASFTVPDASKGYSVQSVNEFGGLSAKATLVGSGVEQMVVDDYVPVAFYDMQGRAHQAPVRGINLVLMRNSAGATRTEKLIVR